MKWEKGFYSKWKNYKWEEYDRDEILKFCIPCRKYEKEGRLVIETRNFRVDAIKQREASKFHILREDFILTVWKKIKHCCLYLHWRSGIRTKSVFEQYSQCFTASCHIWDTWHSSAKEKPKGETLVFFLHCLSNSKKSSHLLHSILEK